MRRYGAVGTGVGFDGLSVRDRRLGVLKRVQCSVGGGLVFDWFFGAASHDGERKPTQQGNVRQSTHVFVQFRRILEPGAETGEQAEPVGAFTFVTAVVASPAEGVVIFNPDIGREKGRELVA